MSFNIIWAIPIGFIPYHSLTLWSFREFVGMTLLEKCDIIKNIQMWVLTYLCRLLRPYIFRYSFTCLISMCLCTNFSYTKIVHSLYTNDKSYLKSHAVLDMTLCIWHLNPIKKNPINKVHFHLDLIWNHSRKHIGSQITA